ncbi:MAG: hypothetical protein DRJ40_02480 [Thermoprotei archaeon]|nr:MAG: hypothetical protein DRJ40_02480 [Thermoprotei archaeon]
MYSIADAEYELRRVTEYWNHFSNLPPVAIGEVSGLTLVSDLKIAVITGSEFGSRFISNLCNYSGFCTRCLSCIGDRCRYGKFDFSKNVVYVHEVPPRTELPSVIDEPEKYLPERLPSVDIVVATGLHSDLYLALPDLLRKSDVKALIVFREDPQDAPYGVIKDLEDTCRSYGIEFATAKPACSLIPDPKMSIITRFVREFRVGRPLIKIECIDGVFKRVEVIVSTPCGCTWFVARNLLDYRFQPNERGILDLRKRAFMLHHTYPCKASMEWDRELGDSLMHIASFICAESVFQGLGMHDVVRNLVIERLKRKIV